MNFKKWLKLEMAMANFWTEILVFGGF